MTAGFFLTSKLPDEDVKETFHTPHTHADNNLLERNPLYEIFIGTDNDNVLLTQPPGMYRRKFLDLTRMKLRCPYLYVKNVLKVTLVKHVSH